MKCLICGADVPVGRFVYCSAACARQAELARARNRDRKHTTPAEAVCPICGKVFKPKPNEKYCSYECKNIARNKLLSLARKRRRTGYSVKNCEICGKEFKPVNGSQKCCSPECSIGERRRKTHAKSAPPTSDKSLEQWCKEAAECNLDYGNYRALITSGKTFEELKAQAASRCVQIHAHGRVHSTH